MKPSRKRFITAVAAGSAASAAAAGRALAQSAPAKPQAPPASPPHPADAAESAARERTAPPATPITVTNPVSDFMVDVLKTLDVDYVAANPGSSFRGIHESILNYGGNRKPELITCTHEEISVALAHGYAKAAGKPMLVLAHSNVGLQHAAMAVYNAWADRVPVVIMAGNALDATMRRPGAEWFHSAVDLGTTLQGLVKYADQPLSAQHYAESTVRAYTAAVTPPMAPVLVALDGELQERPLEGRDGLRVPRFRRPSPPAGDPSALAAAAKLLVEARSPVIVADRAVRTQAGMDELVALAEAAGAPVLDLGSRLNMPTTHWANHTGNNAALIGGADVVLFLEVDEVYGTLYGFSDAVQRHDRRIAPAGATIVTIGLDSAYVASTNNQDAQRFVAPDLPIAGDAETSLPVLVDAVRRAKSGAHAAIIEARTAALKRDYAALRERERDAARWGWDAVPISTARVTYELGEVLRGEDFTITGPVQFFSNWPLRLWPLAKQHQYLGRQGASGEGYAAPALIGAALALKGTGRIPVCIQNDGDLMYQPGSYWTAAHHRIPLLSVMHNNRAWHQEVMHVQRMANRRERGIDRAHIGTTLLDPEIDYAKLIGAMGVWTAGPIREPRDLRPALQKALAAVKRGEPALVDVHTQPR
ncbi:MAG TPA: thiamine pyrophosphate-binding protein [Candidatus Elarobacter sp.]|jgi:thiamine pyrophosphate-dependent acetolactate synthase large subunit-like protein|nr:thiamine pyrophosphate-binding protein [Candidatus Elarobacter sp.]